MRRWIAITLVAVGVAACRTGVPPAPAASGATVIECLGGLDQALCDKAAPVALAAVAASGWTPTHVWINSGSLAPTVDLLFDPGANFPAPNVPDGGTQERKRRDRVRGDRRARGLEPRGRRAGHRGGPHRLPGPALGWCSGTCPSTSATDGPFRLELVLPHLDWKANEPIIGTAILGFDGSALTTIYGSGSGVINFAYAEVGGTRKVDPVWTADCGPHALDPATPINEPLSKSGAIPNDGPDVAFLRSFLTGDGVRLPAGTWDITANAIFTGASGASGDRIR